MMYKFKNGLVFFGLCVLNVVRFVGFFFGIFIRVSYVL